MVIYCAGCFLATRPHISAVAESIRRGLSGGADGGGGTCPPFVGAFTYGEQGPIGENTHANLMYNVLAFGGPKPHSGSEDASKEPLSARELAGRSVSETAAIAAMREQAQQRGDAALVERLDAAAAAAAASRGRRDARRRAARAVAPRRRVRLAPAALFGSGRVGALEGAPARLSRAPHRAIGLPRERRGVGGPRRVPRRRPGRHAELPRDLRAPPGGVAEGPPAESPTWGRSASRGRK